VPDVQAALAGDLSCVSYTLSDLAADTVGLLDVLGLASAHLVGASLGRMVAQTIAIDYPDRVRSLTSMFSTTGDRAVGQTDFAALGPISAPPPDRQGHIDWQVRAVRAVGRRGSRSMRPPWPTGPPAPTTAAMTPSACCASRAGRAWRWGVQASGPWPGSRR
jgi:pimeloyl-ACP methyl ester carboxylesterase